MLLLNAAGAGGTARAKGLAPPMAALDMPPQSFADVYGGEEDLLVTMAAHARDRDDPGMADLLTELERALRDGTLEIKASSESAPRLTQESAPRLTQYVYPVV